MSGCLLLVATKLFGATAGVITRRPAAGDGERALTQVVGEMLVSAPAGST